MLLLGLIIIAVAILTLTIASLIYAFYYQKTEFLIGLVFGIICVGLSVLNATIWFISIFVIPIGVCIAYIKNEEVGKGMLAGVGIGFLASIILFFSKFAQ